ncbi:ABC transporter substrate-binding protein [Streptomyces sp. CBMA156]|uniref:ABC transporter substrate-binding protein n=1 Tax=Streptomyces sp. CBMA156 TaxID=1930280 RepID=UPI00166190A8|nr:ABC transporter substrate-binding protein [Streptomyces sp. CBMA156]MBD0676681.1 iron ABC transporter substrate-binding protein [Streptomyces sp. CBMA156]
MRSTRPIHPIRPTGPVRAGRAIATFLFISVLGACTSAPAPDASGGATGSTGPVSVDNCGTTVTVGTPPARLVTLNEGATEVALALGLQTRMAGTAYLDDSVPEKWKEAYDSVPVLSKKYPTKEQLLSARPDFLYASYSSAFTDKVAGTREELLGQGIPSYLSPFGCSDKSKAAPPTWQAVWGELNDVAQVFGVTDRAAAIQQQQEQQLARFKAEAAGKDLKVLWYDSDTKAPFVGAGHGGPQLVLDAVGARNVFADLPGTWQNVSWEKVVAADPDVIVVADAGWDTAQSKIEYLENDPVLSKLHAVQRKAFVVVPFSESTPGVLLADGAARVSAGLGRLQPGS